MRNRARHSCVCLNPERDPRDTKRERRETKTDSARKCVSAAFRAGNRPRRSESVRSESQTSRIRRSRDYSRHWGISLILGREKEQGARVRADSREETRVIGTGSEEGRELSLREHVGGRGDVEREIPRDPRASPLHQVIRSSPSCVAALRGATRGTYCRSRGRHLSVN